MHIFKLLVAAAISDQVSFSFNSDKLMDPIAILSYPFLDIRKAAALLFGLQYFK